MLIWYHVDHFPFLADEDAGDDGDGNGPGASGDSDGAEEDTGTAAVVPTAASETVAP